MTGQDYNWDEREFIAFFPDLSWCYVVSSTGYDSYSSSRALVSIFLHFCPKDNGAQQCTTNNLIITFEK